MNCAWDGIAFSAQLKAVYGQYECYFVQCRADGSQVQENVTESIAELPYSLEAVCDIQEIEMGWDKETNEISVDNLHIWLEPPWILTKDESVWWVQVDMVLKYNGKTISTVDLLEVCDDMMEPVSPVTSFGTSSIVVEAEPEWGVAPVDPQAVAEPYLMLASFEPIPFALPELRKGDWFELYIEAALNNGFCCTQQFETYIYQEQDGLRPD